MILRFCTFGKTRHKIVLEGADGKMVDKTVTTAWLRKNFPCAFPTK